MTERGRQSAADRPIKVSRNVPGSSITLSLLSLPLILALFRFLLPNSIGQVYYDVGAPVILGIGMLFGIRILQTRQDPEYQQFGFYFTALVGLWFAGELLMAVLDRYFDLSAESLADLLLALGYIPLILYLLRNISEHKKDISPTMWIVTLVVWMTLSATLVQMMIIYGEIFNRETISLVISLYYISCDFLMIFLFLLMLPIWKTTGLKTYWIFLLFGLVGVLIGDVFYIRFREMDPEDAINSGEMQYLFAYAMMVLGLAYILMTPVDGKANANAGQHKMKSKAFLALPTGDVFLIPTSNPKRYLQKLLREIKRGRAGLVISRTMPKTLKNRYDFGTTRILWLTHQSSEDSLDPLRLELIAAKIHDHVHKNPRALLWIDGIEFLVTQNGFPGVLKWLQRVRDLAAVHDATILVTLEPDAFEKKELTLLSRETHALPGSWE